ncbi:hypothetical protein RLON56S_01896 [Alishewanella longhuensis]
MKSIDTKFNVIWTLIIFHVFLLDYWLFSYTSEPRESITVFDRIENPIIALGTLLFCNLLVICAVSKLFMEIWNRLISALFSLRQVGFAESYALCFLLVGAIMRLPGFF